jgi:hypothetical protein
MLKITPQFILCEAGIRTSLQSNQKVAHKSYRTYNMPLNSSERMAFFIYNFSLKLLEVFRLENTNEY